MSDPYESSFGKYELLSRIAIGGMAEIFRARYSPAEGVTKQVVIKRILPHFAVNAAFLTMFTNEAKIAIGLSHGNIAQVFDFGEIAGDYFLAMELVEGQPLSAVMKRAKAVDIPAIPFPIASYITIELLKGLHYAHTRVDEHGEPLRIIHRDVSPQNILIGYEGQVKIVDFGIAKARHATGGETEIGAVKGKYSYFSPEQARAKDLDARTDVFSAGIVLYEMVCGQLPFQGRMMEVLSKIIEGQLTPPRTLNPNIPPALERILLTALANNREDRYASAEAFQQALSGYLYASAPTFSVSSLAQFQGMLFESELLQLGRAVSLSREFLEHVPQWRTPLPDPSAASPLTADTLSGQKALLHEDDDDASTLGNALPPSDTHSASTTARTPNKAMWPYFVGLPLTAAILAAAAVLGWAGVSVQTLELTSNPPGAEVFIDGRKAPTRTPLAIENLPTGQTHSLELSAPGMQPWSKTLPASNDRKVVLHATLEPVPPPQPPEVPDAGVVPRTFGFKLHAAAHAFTVPKKDSVQAKLKSNKRYRLSLESAPADSPRVFFELEGTSSLERGWGALGDLPVVIEHASNLRLFFAETRDGAVKTVRVKLQEAPSGTSSLLKLNTRQHHITLGDSQKLEAARLDPQALYRVSLQLGDARWRKGDLLEEVLLFMEGKPPVVLRKGLPLNLTGADRVFFAFPDSDLKDNAGTLSITFERQ